MPHVETRGTSFESSPASISEALEQGSRRLKLLIWCGLVVVLISLVAIGLRLYLPIYEHRAAILEVHKMGGLVAMEKGGPEWLRGWIGDQRMEIFATLYQVHFPAFSDADFARANLAAHPKLTVLSFVDAKVGDPGMAELRGLTSLKLLHLSGTQITDAGLMELKGLTNLQHLDVTRTAVTLEGIAALQEELPMLNIWSDFSPQEPSQLPESP